MPRGSKPSRHGKPSRRAPVGKAERWLNLLAFLLDRRYPVTREEILSQVEDYKRDWVGGSDRTRESVRRKFERDKSELRTLGVVIEPDRTRVEADHADQEVEAYRLRPRDFYLPYLQLVTELRPGSPGPYQLPTVSLSLDELAILRRAAERVLALGPTPLGPSSASALRKLSFDLPGVTPGGEGAITAAVEPGFQGVFDTLRGAVERRTAVQSRYYAISRDREEERVIEPYGLMLNWGHWYCVGRARERDAIRVFRLNRMRTVSLLSGEGATFQVPPQFRLSEYLNRAPWELSDAPPERVRVRLAFPHSRWTIAEGLGRVVESLDPEGGAVLDFEVRTRESFVRWLLTFGDQAEVLEPVALREQVARLRARVAALYHRS